MTQHKVSLPGSERSRVATSRLVEPLKDDETLSVNLVIRYPIGAPPLPDLSYRGKQHRRHITRQEYAKTYSASPSDINLVHDFVTQHGMTVTETNSATRNVTIKGTVGQFKDAFEIQLNGYESPLPPRRRPRTTTYDQAPQSHIHRGFDGQVRLPETLSGIIIAVVGLDNRSRTGSNDGDSPGAKPLTVPQVSQLYNFPPSQTGTIGAASGQTIGIMAPSRPSTLGSLSFQTGYTQDDINMFFEENLSLKTGIVPVPVNLTVDGTLYENPNEGEGQEITGDICTAAAVALGATINVYFTADTELGWQICLNRILQPPAGALENPPTVVSTSFLF